MVSIVSYSLEEFVHDMSRLVDEHPDQERLFNKGSAYLERLINDPKAIPEEYRLPAGSRGRNANHGTYLLHQGANGLLITSVVWGPDDHLGPHDHRLWGLIGVMDNFITETRFRRQDDRSREGFAQLERDRVNQVKPGDVSLLIPEVDEIHQMDNFSDRATAEIHVYGNDLRGLERSRFDLDACSATDFTTTRFDNC